MLHLSTPLAHPYLPWRRCQHRLVQSLCSTCQVAPQHYGSSPTSLFHCRARHTGSYMSMCIQHQHAVCREAYFEAAVEDELCEHELIRALYGGCNAALQRHNSILVYIPAVSNTFRAPGRVEHSKTVLRPSPPSELSDSFEGQQVKASGIGSSPQTAQHSTAGLEL